MRDLYSRLEKYTQEYYRSLDSKENLRILYDKIIEDLGKFPSINAKELDPLQFSAKWPTVVFSSMALLSKSISIVSLLAPFLFSVSVSLAIVTASVINASFKDISKKERGLKIQAALLVAKEYVFLEAGITKSFFMIPPVSSQKLVSKYSIGETIRRMIDVAGDMLALYGFFIGLIGAGVMVSNSVMLGVEVAIVTLVVIAYGIFLQAYQCQIIEAEKNLMLLGHLHKQHERKYLRKVDAQEKPVNERKVFNRFCKPVPYRMYEQAIGNAVALPIT